LPLLDILPVEFNEEPLWYMAGSVPIKAQSFLDELNLSIEPSSPKKEIAVVLPMPEIEERISMSL